MSLVDNLVKTVRFAKAKGVRSTLVHIAARTNSLRNEWSNSRLDRKYGTDTSGIIADVEFLAGNARHVVNGEGYQGIQVSLFEEMIGRIALNRTEYVFVDFGSGKGRAVMLAAEAGFRDIYGVEFSSMLHDIALENIALFRTKNAVDCKIELVCQDAAEFEIPDANLFCFFYNPFDAKVMKYIIDKILASIKKYPRELVVVYRNPVVSYLFDEVELLELSHEGKGYRIYKSRTALT